MVGESRFSSLVAAQRLLIAGGFSCCGSRLRHTGVWVVGLVARCGHRDFSWTRDRTRVPGFGRQILNPQITRKAPQKPLLKEPRLQENLSMNLTLPGLGVP